MKIAVTYDNGNVFQHFGHSEAFKIYDIQDGKVAASEVIGAEGQGHEALAGLLADKDVEVLICGGIGSGAESALYAEGIVICSGIQGSADEAVDAYLEGTMEAAGANCDHHEQEEAAGCGGGCGSAGGCSSCGGGCGSQEMQVIYEGKNAGKTVKAHYQGTLNDGSQFDSSYDRGEPLEFVCGVGQMIAGFDKAVVDMEVGDVVNIHLTPDEAYGMPDPNYIFTTEIASMPGAEKLHVGDHVALQDQFGRPIPVVVTEMDETMITFDANHEMAGKELNFKIELVEVEA